jgi:hypothetical protein
MGAGRGDGREGEKPCGGFGKPHYLGAMKKMNEN